MTTTKDISKPTIHLNGTDRQALAAKYHHAARSVLLAIDANCEAAPHARDYYPQGPDAFAKAEKEHLAREEALRGVYKELLAIYSSIVEGT